jgi:hypothetical protein
MTINKSYAIFMTLTIILSIAGFTYAHWTGIIRINGRVKMAHILVDIKSRKVLLSKDVEKYSSVTCEILPDNHTLAIYSENLKPCWYIWVGLVMQNQGTLPGKIKPPNYIFEDSNGFEDYFETREYFYGSYPENTGFGNLEVWGKAKINEQLLKDGTVNFETDPTPTPFPINPTEKAVVWIWIHVQTDIPNDAQGQTVTLYINIVDDIAF